MPLPEMVLIKLGGSLITDKETPRTAREAVLERVAAELAGAVSEGPQTGGAPFQVILGHGSGSFGHAAAREYSWGASSDGDRQTERQAEAVAVTQAAALDLHRIVIAALRSAGLRPYSVAPSSCFVVEDGRGVPLTSEPIERALSLGLMPVVFGDVVMDRDGSASILSTEGAFLGLSEVLPVARAIWLGVTDGVYDAEGETVARLDRAGAEKLAATLGGAEGIHVTGGMRLRAHAALTLADRGIPSIIANGRRPGLLRDALTGYQVAATVVEPSIA